MTNSFISVIMQRRRAEGRKEGRGTGRPGGSAQGGGGTERLWKGTVWERVGVETEHKESRRGRCKNEPETPPRRAPP